MRTRHMANECSGPGFNYLNCLSGPRAKALSEGHNTTPNPKAPLGQGGRFAAVEAAARKSGAANPAAVAAAVGRKKYGKKRFQAMAAKGRKQANG